MNYKYLLLLTALIIMYLSCSNSSPSESQQVIVSTKNQSKHLDCQNGRFEKNIFTHLKMHDNVIYGRNISMQTQILWTESP